MQKNPWEIENITIDNDNASCFLRHFIIYDDSKLIKSHYFKIAETNDFPSAIKVSQIYTDVMISIMKINSLTIYLCILDSNIFIIKQKSLPAFKEYFTEHLNSLIFMKAQFKEDFINDLSPNTRISDQNNQILKIQKEIDKAIINEIIRCTIKKSQYRTIKMRQKLLPYTYNSRNKNDYKLSDFILIQYKDFKLYYNSKDQILNVLKSYEDEKRFNNEINFYHKIENTFPFIRKIFGIIKQPIGLPIIILEYVEGESLENYILYRKEIDFNLKIKIIEEILFSIYYVHSNGFYVRDLKPDNIIIDSQNDAILIDFDSSKEMYSLIKEENTGNIGNSFYTAPEQFNSNEYTYKVDSYSVGIIIHFIITRQNTNLTEICERRKNILKNNQFPITLQEYEFIFTIIEKCFEISPNSRPSICYLIKNIIFDNKNDQIKRANEIELPHIINKLEKYESIFKIADSYMNEDPFEQSYLQYFLGYIYYYGDYVSQNIEKSISQLESASNQNNSYAQYLLGEFYYFDKYISRDINKSIHYLTLSANQNNSDAQFFLGLIFYFDQNISQNINKSIHYLTLSANQNNSDAQSFLGKLYYLGEHFPVDINKSIHYLTLSANQNNSDAQYFLGYIYFNSKYISRDINKSIHYLTLSANQNNSDAQSFLGKLYYLGEHFPVDINKSIHYLTLSAYQNNSDALFFLGIIYLLGKYISRDINKSIHYFTLSANQNNSDAQRILGNIYYNFKYISRDINKSIHYLTLSANQYNSYAQYLLGKIYYDGEYISRDINKSIHYLTLSANQNNSDAQLYLGTCFLDKQNVSPNINESIHYLTLSANQNNSYASYFLGAIYYLKKYNLQDINKSIHYLTLSANQNNSHAQRLLGEIYYNGKYISHDINKSIHYLTLSANQYNSNAQCLLGEIYYNGKYIKKNIQKSIHYFKESSCFYNSTAKNYLGIIYKNGDGVEKNIYFAKIFLKEAIKQKEESYSMYNLARIYYFGIQMERKILKAILLLEKASNKQLYIANLFLFYIFSKCDDKHFLNKKKSGQYKKKCQKNSSYQYNNILPLDALLIYVEKINNFQKLHNFLRDYDLLHNKDYLFDFLYYILSGKFSELENQDDDKRKNIDADFYEGLNE